MRRGFEALDKRVFDHRDTFGQPHLLNASYNVGNANVKQNVANFKRPSKLSHEAYYEMRDMREYDEHQINN